MKTIDKVKELYDKAENSKYLDNLKLSIGSVSVSFTYADVNREQLIEWLTHEIDIYLEKQRDHIEKEVKEELRKLNSGSIMDSSMVSHHLSGDGW